MLVRLDIIRCVTWYVYTAIQSQKTVTAYFSSTQLLPFVFAEQYSNHTEINMAEIEWRAVIIHPLSAEYDCIKKKKKNICTFLSSQIQLVILLMVNKKVFVSNFRFIWIPIYMLSGYGSTAFKNIFTLKVQGSTLDVRIWRLQTSDCDV